MTQYITFTPCWQSIPDDLRVEIAALWQKHKALPTGVTAEDRMNEVAAVATDEDQRVLGIGTVIKRFVPELDMYFYFFRTFSDPSVRNRKLARDMLITCYQHMGEWSKTHDPEVVGVYTELENDLLQKHLLHARMPHSSMTYIGMTANRIRQRIRYFPHAKLTPSG